MSSSKNKTYKLEEWISLSVVIFRMLAVCWSAAAIHEKSSDTVGTLDDVPIDNNTQEVKMFREFASSTKVVLSGLRLFSITKGLILTV
jgi:hypothetical protein